jgi:hypothetical protein
MYAVVDPTAQSDYHFDSIAPIRHFLKKSTGQDTTTMSEFQLLLGIVIGFQMIIRLGIERCKRILAIIDHSKSKDLKGHWSSDLGNIKLDFFRDLMYKVDRILLRFDDVIAYCHSVTVEQFNIHFGDDLSTELLKEMALCTEQGYLDVTRINTKAKNEQEELEKLMAERDKADMEKKREIEEAKEAASGHKLIDFDQVDKKIEAMFGLKMGEFLKDDEEILQSSIGGQSSIRRRRDEKQDDTILKNLADDLKSRRTDKSGKSEALTKKSGKQGQSKDSKKAASSNKKSNYEEEGENEGEENNGEEAEEQSNNRSASKQASKRSKFSQPKKPNKSKVKDGASRRSKQ